MTELERSYLQRGSVPQGNPVPDTEVQTDDGYGRVHVPEFVETAQEGELLGTAEALAEDEPLANDSY